MTILAKIQIRRDTAANWVMANPTLSFGEGGVETDTQRVKYGDGATAWTSLPYEGVLNPSGTVASPTAITAGAGVSVSAAQRQLQFVKGSGGPVTISASPQIEDGDFIGQELTLRGCDDTNTLTLSNGTGLVLNGSCTLRNGSTLGLFWDGSDWTEAFRNDL